MIEQTILSVLCLFNYRRWLSNDLCVKYNLQIPFPRGFPKFSVDWWQLHLPDPQGQHAACSPTTTEWPWQWRQHVHAPRIRHSQAWRACPRHSPQSKKHSRMTTKTRVSKFVPGFGAGGYHLCQLSSSFFLVLLFHWSKTHTSRTVGTHCLLEASFRVLSIHTGTPPCSCGMRSSRLDICCSALISPQQKSFSCTRLSAQLAVRTSSFLKAWGWHFVCYA